MRVEDQTFDHPHNESLVVRYYSSADGAGLTILQISCTNNTPVRVVRGHKLDSKYAPPEGFVIYNGVYCIVSSQFLGTATTVFTK